MKLTGLRGILVVYFGKYVPLAHLKGFYSTGRIYNNNNDKDDDNNNNNNNNNNKNIIII